MRNVRYRLIKNFPLVLFAFFLTELPVFAFAECPSGYRSTKEYHRNEVSLKWGDEPSGTYSICRDTGWPGIYQCGNVKVGPNYLENTHLLQVHPSNPSIGSILFEEESSFTRDEPERQWCEREGAQVICYEESISKKTFMPSSSNWGINKRVDYLLKQKYIAESAEVSF